MRHGDTYLYADGIKMMHTDGGDVKFPYAETTASISPTVRLTRARGTSSSWTPVAIGDVLGSFTFDGTFLTQSSPTVPNYASGAEIRSTVEFANASAGGRVPANLQFFTKASGSTTLTERMTIAHDGEIGIGTTNPQSLLHVNGVVRATDICDENGANCKDISGGWGGGGDIDGVYTSTGLTGGFASGSGTLSVDVGTTTGKIVQVAASNKLPAMDGSDLSSINAVKLQTRDIASTAPTASQVLGWNAGTSSWEPQTVSVSASQVSGAFANGGNSFGGAATVGTNDNFAMNFEANGATAMTILPSGNVGVGAASPLAKLHVNGGTGSLATGLAFGDGDTGIFEENDDELVMAFAGSNRWWFNTGGISTPTGNGSGIIVTDGDVNFRPKSSEQTGMGRLGVDILGLYTANTPRMVIDATGKVGIGNVSPAHLLDVNGGRSWFSNSAASSVVHITSSINTDTTNAVLSLSRKRGDATSPAAPLAGRIDMSVEGFTSGSENNVANIIWGWEATPTAAASTEDSYMAFSTAQNATVAERMRLTSDGKLGIGTSTPEVEAHIYGTTSYTSLSVENNATTGAWHGGAVDVTTHNTDQTDWSLSAINLTTNRGAKGANTTMQSGDYLGELSFWGSTDTATGERGAYIRAAAAANWTLTSSPADLYFYTTPAGSVSPTSKMRITHDGRVGVGVFSPTATLHIKGGSAAANTAPIKFTASTIMTTPENGAMEFDGTDLFLTTGGTRKKLSLASTSNDFTSVGSITGSGALTVATGGSNNALTLTSAGTTGNVVVNAGTSSGNIDLNPGTTGFVNLNSAVASTTPATGALVVDGGVGIIGALNVGMTISAATSLTVPLIYGSSSSGGDITIDSTSHVTKGDILLAPTIGNVGIGSTDPSSRLDITAVGTVVGTHEQLVLRSQNASLTPGALVGGVAFKSFDSNLTSPGVTVSTIDSVASTTHTAAALDSDIVFRTTAALAMSERMRIAASGNVGIGTASPNAVGFGANSRVLSIQGAVNSQGAIELSGNPAGSAAYGTLVFANSADSVAAVESYRDGASDAGTLSFLTQATGGSTAERMRITSAGNVGIGTVSPNQLLTVEGPMSLRAQAAPTLTANYGKVYVDSGDANKLKYMNPAGTITDLTAGASSFANGGNSFGAAATIGTNDNQNFVIETNGNNRVIFQSDGDINFGAGGTLYGGQTMFNFLSNPYSEAGDFAHINNDAYFNSAANTGTAVGIRNWVRSNTANNHNNMYASHNIMTHFGGGSMARGVGSFNVAENPGGNATDLAGTWSSVDIGSGTVTNAYGVKVEMANAGTLTNAYGIHIDALAGTNKWGVYQAGASDRNYFAGSVGIGTTSPGELLEAASNTWATITSRVASDTQYPGLMNIRSRGTLSAQTAVLDDDRVLSIQGRGYDGANARNAASILFEVDGTPSTGNDMPGRIVFATTPDNTSAVVERMRIDSVGNVGIGTTAPSAPLEVQNTTNGPGILISRADDVNDKAQISFRPLAALSGSNVQWSAGLQNNSNHFFLSTWDGTGVTIPLMVQNNGYVGFGTANPSVQGHFSGTNAKIWLDAYATSPDFMGRQANGTPGAPTASASNDALAVFGGRGYGATGFSANSRGSMRIHASEAWTDAAQGTQINFNTTPNGSTVSAERMRINHNGNIGVGNSNPPSRFIVSPPAQQAITAGATITADACGTIKKITAAGAVTTNTTNTFTASTADYDGCCMDVINQGAFAITLDTNTAFRSAGAANVVLGQYDTVRVCSDGATWYQIGGTGNN